MRVLARAAFAVVGIHTVSVFLLLFGDAGIVPAIESALALNRSTRPSGLPWRTMQWPALPLVRKEFDVRGEVDEVTLRLAGLGDYDPRVNGQRLASTGINQPWSQYENTIYYRDYDITELVQPGRNCLGVMLTNSFWDNSKPPAGRYYKDGPQRTAIERLLLRAEIVIKDTDGAVQLIGTDSTWRTDEGPIVFSHIFAGEDFDARRTILAGIALVTTTANGCRCVW